MTLNDERMQNQLEDLRNIFEVQVMERKSQVDASLKSANHIFYSVGELEETDSLISLKAINQVTKQESYVQVNSWQLNQEQLQLNYQLVDEIQEITGITATIFQKIDDGFLRVSTNVRNLDNTRAVGTYIPNSSPVIQAINRGETFRGRAFVVDDWYITAYEPIYLDGQIKGILYVGGKEKDLGFLKSKFRAKKYFTTGYPFTISLAGDPYYLIHPEKEGDKVSNQELLSTMQESENGKFRIYDKVEGHWEWIYYDFYAPFEVYNAITIPEVDFIGTTLARLRNLTLAGCLVALVISLIAINYLVNSITDPIQKLVSIIGDLAKGNLLVDIHSDRQDEIGDLMNSQKNMVNKIKDVIKLVRQVSGYITSASNQLSAGSQQIAQGANEQASSTEEVSSSMEEMVTNIQQNAENAQVTEKITLKLTNDVKESNKALSNTVDSMKNIVEKISVIGEIARQTNILALNAAVEAARAGEHGKGFAVVAAEVRKLAERSQESAKEIDTISKSSMDVAVKSGELLSNIIPEMEKTAKLVQEISAASKEQNGGADQINSAIQQLNQITQKNASSSEEIATNSEELSAQAQQLMETISFFQLELSRQKLSNPSHNDEVQEENEPEEAETI
ncbi:MAG: Cache 3/Cache 2 fusion domain-containing protein [Candidatus Cyclobacteriaceae bacterium M3_2C_046]